MASNDLPEPSELRRIGFLADTHSRKADGSDLPQQALDAFTGVDLIVHLGDVGQKGILDRLAHVAPVFVPAGGDKGWIPASGGKTEPVRVIEAAGTSVGLTFNLSKPDKAITPTDAGIEFGGTALPDLIRKRFGRSVDVVAFGGTHRAWQEERDGVLFFNPGSPTLPVDSDGENDLGSVAVLDLTDGGATVQLIRLRTI